MSETIIERPARSSWDENIGLMTRFWDVAHVLRIDHRPKRYVGAAVAAFRNGDELAGIDNIVRAMEVGVIKRALAELERSEEGKLSLMPFGSISFIRVNIRPKV